MLNRKSLLERTEVAYKGGWSMPAPHTGYPHALKLRDKVASRYDEASGFALPGRDGITKGPDQSEIYDDTAVIAVPEFASRVQQGVIPNFSEWAGYVAGILISGEEKDELTRALEPVNGFLFEMLNASNFAVEANESFIDLALGTMALRLDEGTLDNPFNARAVPLRSLVFCVGPDGLPDPVYETRKVPLNTVQVHYPQAKLPDDLFAGEDPYGEVTLVEAWHRDWSRPTEHHYRQSVFVPDRDNRSIMEEWHHGAGSKPIVVSRWGKASGEGWGRGPLFNLLPSLRKVNFAERALLDHTDIALAGIWTLEDDGVVNTETVRLEPGTLVPVALGSQGLKNVAPGADFNIANFVLNEARENIRKALYTEQLGNPNKTPMSATEVEQRMAELARAIGAPFGRLILEFVMPVVVRCTYILRRRGMIKLPKVDGKEIKLIPTSPLAQAQRFEDVGNLQRFGQTLQGILGPEGTNIAIDQPEFAIELAEKLQIPKRIVRPKAKQEQIMQALTNMAAQQQGAGGGGGQQPA